MLSRIRDRSLLWALFVFITFLNPALAAPQHLFGNDLSRRANAPGLGVKLKMSRIVIVGKPGIKPEERQKLKSAEVISISFAGSPKTH